MAGRRGAGSDNEDSRDKSEDAFHANSKIEAPAPVRPILDVPGIAANAMSVKDCGRKM